MSSAVKARFVATGEDRTAQAFDSVDRRLRQTQRRAMVAAKALAGLFVLRRVARFAAGLAKEMTDIHDQANKAGMAAEDFQRLGGVFDILIGKGELIANRIVPRMIQQLSDPRGQRALRRLGLELENIQRLSRADQFKEIINAMQRADPDTARRAAGDLFGRRGAQEVEGLLQMDADTFRRRIESYSNLINVASKEQVAQMNQLTNAFDLLRNNIKAELMVKLTKLAKTFGLFDDEFEGTYKHLKQLTKIVGAIVALFGGGALLIRVAQAGWGAWAALFGTLAGKIALVVAGAVAVVWVMNKLVKWLRGFGRAGRIAAGALRLVLPAAMLLRDTFNLLVRAGKRLAGWWGFYQSLKGLWDEKKAGDEIGNGMREGAADAARIISEAMFKPAEWLKAGTLAAENMIDSWRRDPLQGGGGGIAGRAERSTVGGTSAGGGTNELVGRADNLIALMDEHLRVTRQNASYNRQAGQHLAAIGTM